MPKSNKWAEYAALKKEVDESTKVNKDALVDSLLTGQPIVAAPTSSGQGVASNEGSLLPGMSMNPKQSDLLFHTAASAIGADGMSAALHDDPSLIEQYGVSELAQSLGVDESISVPTSAGPTISSRQYVAIQKFPALVEFLGSDHGEQLAASLAEKVSSLMVTSIGDNAKKLSKFAHSCTVDKQNIKQYFVGENKSWACQVIANGPFRGDEAIYYNETEDKSYVLRLKGQQYEDVSQDFNVVHECATNSQGESDE